MKQTIHLSARTHNNLFFPVPTHSVWKSCLSKLSVSSHLIDIQSFVLMNNHYHLLFKAKDSNIKTFLKDFRFTYFDESNIEVIRSNRYLRYTYKYIYQNPIRANLVNRVQDYPFSSIHYKSKGMLFDFPIHDKFGMADEFKLHWLNET